jgi:S-phase kinase-associated protein 1
MTDQQLKSADDADDEILQLKGSNGDEIFQVPRTAAMMSKTISHLLEDLDDGTKDAIPIPNIEAAILKKVIEYMTHHKDDPALTEEQVQEKRGEDITGWDATFVDLKNNDGKPDMATLFKLILAADFLDIKPMLDLMCKSVAHLVRGKTNEEIRLLFGITTEFTKEEMDEVRKNNPWCDDQASSATA